MPEGPELQAHAERLDAAVAGVALERFRPLAPHGLRTADPPPDAADGTVLTGVTRRGKYLLVGTGPVTFVVHLMQAGRLRLEATAGPARPRGGLARWQLADGRALLLTEAGREHRAGVWVLAGDPEQTEPLAGLGPEADRLTSAALLSAGRERPARLHGLLRDQQALAGVGRRLANEVCWRAKRSPFARSADLDEPGAEAVVEALRAAWDESLADERAQTDLRPSAKRLAHVHGRAGRPCEACGDTLRAVTYRSYEVVYCPACQTGGRVLADNTTSRFLR